MTAAWQLESLGRGVHLFRWNKGFYLSTFVVGDRGVTAIDPISDAAAVAYRSAIAQATDRPLARIVYSHDHRDWRVPRSSHFLARGEQGPGALGSERQLRRGNAMARFPSRASLRICTSPSQERAAGMAAHRTLLDHASKIARTLVTGPRQTGQPLPTNRGASTAHRQR